MTHKRKIAFEALQFFAKKLRIMDYDATIHLDFKFGYTDLFGIFGQCDYSETGLIVIDVDVKTSDTQILGVIAHEMVHARQWLSGVLSTTDNGLYQTWKGKKIPASVPYSAEPWEREAMRKEVIMSHQFLESRK